MIIIFHFHLFWTLSWFSKKDDLRKLQKVNLENGLTYNHSRYSIQIKNVDMKMIIFIKKHDVLL